MSINNKRSYTEYTVTQPTTDFAIGFDDFDEGSKDNILVTLNGVLVESLGYAAIRKNASTVTITPAITEGTVRLTRETDIDEPFHKFTAGALFSAKSMDENFQQVRHSQQEVRDGFVFLEYNTNGIVQASKEATAQAKAATVEATASAVRAETAADTAVQAVGTLQGVVNAATTATTNANTATATANTAASQAAAATTSAQNAALAATVAKQEATIATANANAATVDTLAATGRANDAADVVADLVVGKVRAQDVSTTDGSTQDVKNTEFRNELDTLPEFINGKLSDSVVSIMRYGIERTQEEKNREALTPFDFGAIGDGTYHPVSDWTVVGSRVYFANLAEIQVKFPHVTSLTDSIDWAALQAFFNHCHDFNTVGANVTIKAYINKPILYNNEPAKTKIFYGDMTLITDLALDYMFWVTGRNVRFLGGIFLVGAPSSTVQNLKTKQGIIIGSLVGKESRYASNNLYIHYIEAQNFVDCAVHWGDLSHFSTIGAVSAVRVGSGVMDSAYLSHNASISNVVHTGDDVQQRSVLTVDSLPPVLSSRCFATVDGVLYKVHDVDRINSTISVYPLVDMVTAPTKIHYHYGTGVYTRGNDTSNLRLGTLKTIQCGIGVHFYSLYGMTLGTFTSEAVGVGVLVADSFETSVGNTIESGYFELNTWDVAYGWSADTSALFIKRTIAINPDKITSLYKFRYGYNNEFVRGSYQRWGRGEIEISGRVYNTEHDSTGEVTSPELIQHVTTNTVHTLTGKESMITGIGKRSNVYILIPSVMSGAAPNLTLNGGTGVSINGLAEPVIILGADFNGAVVVTVYHVDKNNYVVGVVGTRKEVTKKTFGITSERPTQVSTGFQYFDTTLGKPVLFNGTAWVGAGGTSA